MRHYSVLANPDDDDVGLTQTTRLAPIQFSSQVIKKRISFFFFFFHTLSKCNFAHNLVEDSLVVAAMSQHHFIYSI